MYESEIYSKETSTINSTVINNEYLYFIVIDNKNNIFRHYFETIIHNSYWHTKHNYNYDSRMFIFSLINKRNINIKKYENISNIISTQIYNDKWYYYYCNEISNEKWCYIISNINKNENNFYINTSKEFKLLENNTIRCNDYNFNI